MNETKPSAPRLPVQASVDRGQGFGALSDAPGVDPSAVPWGAIGQAALQALPIIASLF